MSISAVLVVKNEENNLARALNSLAFVDEIILVDMQSSDKTIAIAEKFHCQIFSAPRDSGYVEPARNFSVSKAKSDWILVLDADEEISPQLAELILKTIKQPLADVYFIARANIIFKKFIMHSAWWPDYQARLFKKGSLKWSEKIHVPPSIKGRIEYLAAKRESSIIHHNYDKIEDFVDRSQRYTTLRASEKKLKKTINSKDLLTAFNDEFFKRFFFHKGYLDGTHGLALALLQSNYELLVKLKQWQAQGFPEDKLDDKQLIKALKANQKNFNYWLTDLEITEAKPLKRIYLKFKRKFGL